MKEVIIKTAEGNYVGRGEQDIELVNDPSKAFRYPDGPAVDSQLTIVNLLYGGGWHKVDAEAEIRLTQQENTHEKRTNQN